MIHKKLLFALACATLLLGSGCRRGEHVVNPGGTFEATETDINSLLAARAISVRAELGSRVRQGDTLIVLDTELLTLQRAQSETQRNVLAAQRLVLNDQLAQAELTLGLAETNFSRIETLLREQTAAQQQFDEAKTKRDVAREQAQQIRHQISLTHAEEERLDAALRLTDRQLKDGVILAPTSGTVIMKAIEQGETVSPASVLMRIADLSQLELRVFLGEQELDRVKVGESYDIHVDALPGTPLKGTITWVSSEAEFTPKNAQTRAARAQLVYAVKLRVNNPDGTLHIGMPAELVLP